MLSLLIFAYPTNKIKINKSHTKVNLRFLIPIIKPEIKHPISTSINYHARYQTQQHYEMEGVCMK